MSKNFEKLTQKIRRNPIQNDLKPNLKFIYKNSIFELKIAILSYPQRLKSKINQNRIVKILFIHNAKTLTRFAICNKLDFVLF